MDLAALLASRRSIRRFRPEAPPRELLEKLIEAAVTAPSASNRQPWRFLVVTSAKRIAELSCDVSAAVDRVAGQVEAGSEAAFRAYGDYFTRFAAAPVLLVPIYRPSPVLSHLVRPTLDPIDRSAIDEMERSSALTGASLALQNILLMAHSLGLGASAMTGPLLAESALRQRLAVPAGWSLVALVPVGYPDETPPAPERKPAARVTRWIDEDTPEPSGTG